MSFPRRPAISKNVGLLIKGGASLAVLAILLSFLDPAVVLSYCARVPAWALVAAFVLLFAQIMITVVRWVLVVGVLGSRLPFLMASRITLVSVFFGQLLPSSIGSDALRMWAMHKMGMTLSLAVTGVALERIGGLISLVVTVVAASPVLLITVADPSIAYLVFLCSGLVVVGTVILLLGARMPGDWRKYRLLSFVSQLGQHAGMLLSTGRERWWILGISIIGQVFISLSVYLLARGMDLAISPLLAMAVVPPIMLVTTFPVAISGWGLREGAMVIVLGYLGVPKEGALAVSVLYGILSLAAGIPGGILWVLGDRSLFAPKKD